MFVGDLTIGDRVVFHNNLKSGTLKKCRSLGRIIDIQIDDSDPDFGIDIFVVLSGGRKVRPHSVLRKLS